MSEPLDADLNPDTLHEYYPDSAAADARIEALRAQVRDAGDFVAELLARGDLTDTLRIAGHLDAAREQAQRAVDRAEMAGTAAQQHLARLRLAQVHQWLGEFAEANLGFTELTAAAAQFGPVIEAFTRDAAGRNAYDQGHLADAAEQFARALAIRERLELPEAAASRRALDAARARQGEGQ